MNSQRPETVCGPNTFELPVIWKGFSVPGNWLMRDFRFPSFGQMGVSGLFGLVGYPHWLCFGILVFVVIWFFGFRSQIVFGFAERIFRFPKWVYWVSANGAFRFIGLLQNGFIWFCGALKWGFSFFWIFSVPCPSPNGFILFLGVFGFIFLVVV